MARRSRGVQWNLACFGLLVLWLSMTWSPGHSSDLEEINVSFSAGGDGYGPSSVMHHGPWPGGAVQPSSRDLASSRRPRHKSQLWSVLTSGTGSVRFPYSHPSSTYTMSHYLNGSLRHVPVVIKALDLKGQQRERSMFGFGIGKRSNMGAIESGRMAFLPLSLLWTPPSGPRFTGNGQSLSPDQRHH